MALDKKISGTIKRQCAPSDPIRRLLLLLPSSDPLLFCFIGDLGLKGPKHEIFESGFFTHIRGLWLDDLGTGEKN
jgi:hypothetical protein